MDEQMELFSNKALKEMIVPLFLEQLLIMLVGLADTLVVSYAGEAAVSGVSLVNQFKRFLPKDSVLYDISDAEYVSDRDGI